MWTRRLADADASCGGKAYGLARMIKAGLRVPEGFVIEDRAFRLALGDLAIDSRDAIGHGFAEAARRIANAKLPADLVQEVESAGRALGGRLAVRSSASIEDGEAGAAAGVFSSQAAVPLDELWFAILMVWTSALTPLAASYARHRDAATISMSVIVQRFVEGEPVIVYTRPPGSPAGDEMLLQHGGRLLRVPRNHSSPLLATEIVLATDRGVDIELVVPRSPTANTKHVTHASADGTTSSADGTTRSPGTTRAPASATRSPDGTTSSPTETTRSPDGSERVWSGLINLPTISLTEDDLAHLDLEHAWFVQARPIVHPVVKQRVAPPPMVVAALQDGRVWRLDVTHNPDPLSPAQAGLVERVEHAGATPWSSRVCTGYLYTTSRESIAVDAPTTVDELRTQVERIERRLGAALDPRGATDEHADVWSLASVLDRYVAFCRIWAYELGPLIAACRGTQPVGAGRRASAAESALSAAARGRVDETTVVALLGVLAPAWDVAVSTFQEQPGRVRDAIARLSFSEAGVVEPSTTSDSPTTRDSSLEPMRRVVETSTTTNDSVDDPSTAVLEYIALLDSLNREQPSNLADAAADLAERDDYWFAIAQWTVRRAIDQRAHELGISTEDAFWVPLDELVAGEIDPVDATRRASGARAAAARATGWNMPIIVGASTTESGVALQGIGFGPSVTGRVRRFDSLASAIVVGRGDIVVTRAVTPALAVIVVGCAAIVSETGGLLDHGAAMARELGIPCVVGCRDAWSRLADGMIVTVANGTVVPIASDQNVNR